VLGPEIRRRLRRRLFLKNLAILMRFKWALDNEHSWAYALPSHQSSSLAQMRLGTYLAPVTAE